MQRDIRKLSILLALFIALPALIYSLWEWNDLNESEALLQQIYSEQINTLFFSINQYTLDYAQIFFSKVDASQAGNPESQTGYLKGYPEIATLGYFDRGSNEVSWWHKNDAGARQEQMTGVAKQFFTRADGRQHLLDFQRKLQRYRQNDYRKVESLTAEGFHAWLYPSSRFELNRERILIAVFSNQDVFTNVIMPRLQQLAKDRFTYVLQGPADTLRTGAIDNDEVIMAGDLWLFPGTTLRLYQSGLSVSHIVRNRFISNIVVIGIINLLLLLAAILIIRTIRRQIALNRIKADFTANISHELRTPLALIRMYSETLAGGRIHDPAKQKRYLFTLQRESERLSLLVDNILNFARMESGKFAYTFAAIAIHELIEETLQSLEPQLVADKFIIQRNFYRQRVIVAGDKDALSIVFHNLLDNAIKYSPQEKHISIATRVVEGYAQIDFTDRGKGIAREKQKDIFSMFIRAESTDVHESKGSGLGLAMVERIIKDHNGEVRVHSEVGRGSTFTLELPLAKEQEYDR
jgi:two-component system phosphate regulon sensor histidine kinase PhoR